MTGIPSMIRGIQAWGDAVEVRAGEIMQEAAEDGAEHVREVVETAFTRTGEKRAAAGKGVAGRIETGDMHSDVDSSYQRQGNVHIAEWGWRDAKNYYAIQELGATTGFNTTVRAMNSLLSSSDKVENRVMARLKEISS